MILRLFIMLLLVGAVIGGVFYYKNQQWQQMNSMASQGQPPATVATAKVQEENWQPSMQSVGSLVAVNDINVTNETEGMVAEIKFESGQQVKKGDVILLMDDKVDRAELAGLRAMNRLAKIQYDRSAKLVKENTVSKSTFDEARANLANSRASVASKEAIIEQKKIIAPFSGLLGIRQVNLGEYLQSGSDIVPLQSLDPIYVDYTLPERYLADIKVGQQFEVSLQAYQDKTYKGQIMALNSGIDPGTRSVMIRGTLDNPEGALRPGMFAEVNTMLPRRDKVLTLPQQTITYAPYGNSVFLVVDNEGKKIVQRRQVITGTVRNGNIEIIEGLKLGDEVVSAGQVKLRNDQPVLIDNSIQVDPVKTVSSQ